MKTNRTLSIIAAILAASALAWLVVVSLPASTIDINAQAAGKERIGWAIISKLQVLKGGSRFDSDVAVTGDVAATGDVSAVNVTASGDLTVSGTANLAATSTTGDTAITGTLAVVGASDAVLVTITGYTTQTSNLMTLEQSDGTAVVTVTNAGAVNAVDFIASDDVTVGDQLSVAGLTLPGFTNATITNGDTITAAFTTYALDSSVASTITLAAVGEEGQELVLVADDAFEITINDTNIRAPGGGVITMTQYYVTGWRFQDAEWLLAYRSINQ